MTFKKSIYLLFAFLFISTLFISCDDDDMDCCPMPEESENDVWIINEGLFTQGNASLDLYNSDSNTVATSAFNDANGRAVGDILQSMTFYNDYAYLFVNNSQRIEVIRVDDQTSITTISEGVYSPRYGVVLNDQLYFSDISKNFIFILDVNKNAVIDSIDTRVPVEELVIYDNKILATANNFSTPFNQLYVIDPIQKKVVDSVEVGLNPNALVMDKEDHLWVMCDGQFGVPGSEGLYRINASTLEVTREISFPYTPSYPTRLAVNASDANALFINGPDGVYKLELDATEIPSTPFLNYSGSLYGLNIHPELGDIYIGDAADFSSFGQVHIFDMNANMKSSFTAGYLPARFYFR